MLLRSATPHDLPRLVEIATTSQYDEPGENYLWPKRDQYPEDYSLWTHSVLDMVLHDKNRVLLVVEMSRDKGDQDDSVNGATANPASVVVSFGIWWRTGDASSVRKWFDSNKAWVNDVDGK